jgi:hypothetical protein
LHLPTELSPRNGNITGTCELKEARPNWLGREVMDLNTLTEGPAVVAAQRLATSLGAPR